MIMRMSSPNPDKTSIQTGNAELDSTETRGWFVGSFLAKEYGLRSTDDVEIKWGIHKAEDSRDEWVTGETRTTLGILISGKYKMNFREQTVTLSKPGDYVMWGPGVDHKWQVIEGGVFLTVRWPSISQQ
jgi:uncharacterized cupin superfamily protein